MIGQLWLQEGAIDLCSYKKSQHDSFGCLYIYIYKDCSNVPQRKLHAYTSKFCYKYLIFLEFKKIKLLNQANRFQTPPRV